MMFLPLKVLLASTPAATSERATEPAVADPWFQLFQLRCGKSGNGRRVANGSDERQFEGPEGSRSHERDQGNDKDGG